MGLLAKVFGGQDVHDLEAVKARLELLPAEFPAAATAVGPGVGQAKEQIPIICRNIGDAVAALRTGRDPNGNPIDRSQVGMGLQNLVADVSGPGFTGLMLVALSPEGVRELEGLIGQLGHIAGKLRDS